MIGASLGHYRIVRELGAGGMGQVYAAEDTKLGRQVALKILPPGIATRPDLAQRFRREAEAIAALDHPNIVTVYSIETAKPDEPADAEPIHFITMQLVEGQTLTKLIPEDGMPLPRFLDLALQLVDGVSAVHGKGITHRDLKPGNIMVGEDGRVRILDFGLAKLSRIDARVEEPGDINARTEVVTRDGTVLGTAPYMSPELAKGVPADPRSDIFSLGIVFHELLLGDRPFKGDTVAELLTAILRDSPSTVSDTKSELPPRIGDIVGRCLEKECDDRYQAARDLHADLEALRRELEIGAEAGTSARSSAGAQASSLARFARPSLAVLPFANLSDDPEQDYFAKGLSADINADLVKLSGLALISVMTTSLYANKEVKPEDVGAELGVRHVLMGTVRKAGNRLRITAQLVDTRTDEPIWGNRFDGELDDLFTLQDQITDEIVTALDVELAYGEGERITRKSIKNPRARDLYYRSLRFVFSSNVEEVREAYRLLVEAAEIEPDSPILRALAAWALYFEARTRQGDSPSNALDEAAALVDKAIELNDPTGMAQMLKGAIHLANREYDKAMEATEKSLEHRPSCPWAYVLKGNVYNYTGRPAEAIDLAIQAIRLTPLFPPLYPAVLATGYYLDDQPHEAACAARDAIALGPDTLDTQVMLAAAQAAAGNPEARSAAQGIRRIKNDFSIEEFVASQPFKDPAVAERLKGHLRAAGL